MSGDDYELDPAALAALVRRMAACVRTLQDLTDDVERSIVTLQGTWHGEAAQAQELAHREWEQGLTTMREAIDDLRDKGQTAHDNYAAAVEANVSMWQSAQGS